MINTTENRIIDTTENMIDTTVDTRQINNFDQENIYNKKVNVQYNIRFDDVSINHDCNKIEMLLIKIIKKSDETKGYEINIAQFKMKFEVEENKITEEIMKIISCIFNFDKCKLSGLSVKDDNTGLKIRPVIDIYIQKNILYSLPTELQFSKDSWNINKNTNKRTVPFICNSEILNNLLDNLKLSFVCNNGNKCVLSKIKKKCYIDFLSSDTIDVLDNILGYSEQLEIRKAIKSYNAPFTILLQKIIFNKKLKNEIKSFYRMIKNGLNDIEYAYLCDVIANAPIFYDFRDAFIDGLEKYLKNDEVFENLNKYNYLETRRMKILKRGSNIGLKKLLE